MGIEDVIRRIQSDNKEARSRQSAAFSELTSQTLDPNRTEINIDEIMDELTTEPEADDDDADSTGRDGGSLQETREAGTADGADRS